MTIVDPTASQCDSIGRNFPWNYMNIRPSSIHDTGRRTEAPELKIDSVAPRNHASRPPLILASILGSVSGGLPMGPGQPYLTYLISEVG